MSLKYEPASEPLHILINLLMNVGPSDFFLLLLYYSQA